MDRMERCAKIVEALHDRRPPTMVPLDELGRGNDRPAAESVLMIKALAYDLGVRNDDCIIKACEEAKQTDSVDWAICSHVAVVYGHEDEEFADSVLTMVNQLLRYCNGIHLGLNFFEGDLERALSYRLKKFGLRIKFTGRYWNKPFTISLFDIETEAALEESTFQYSDYQNRRDMREIIELINHMISGRGLIFFEADDGSDSYSFILFEKSELDRLNKKYGGVGKLIIWGKRLDNWKFQNPEPTDPELKRDWAEIQSSLKQKWSWEHKKWGQICDIAIAESVRLLGVGELEDSLKLLTVLDRLCRKRDDKNGLQRSTGIRAFIYQQQENWSGAMKALREEERLCRETANKYFLQNNLAGQARVLHKMGDMESAVKVRIEEGLICRAMDNKKALQQSLGHLAWLYNDLGEDRNIMDVLKELVIICRELGDSAELERYLAALAIYWRNLGDDESALKALAEQEQICRKLGNLMDLQLSLGYQADILMIHGNSDLAMSLLAEKERISRQLNLRKDLHFALSKRSEILYANGDFKEVLILIDEIEAISRELNDTNELISALTNKALALDCLRRSQEAIPVAEDALKLAMAHGDQGVIENVQALIKQVYRS